MEKLRPPSRLKMHMLVLNLLPTVRNKEFLLCRKVRSQLSPPAELMGDHCCSQAKRQLFPRGTGGYETVGGRSPAELNQLTAASPRSPLHGAGGEEGMGVLTATPRWPGIPGTPRTPTSPRGPGGPG